MDLNNFKFDFSGLSFDKKENEAAKAVEEKKNFDFELATKNLKEEAQKQAKEAEVIVAQPENNEVEAQIEKDEAVDEAVKDSEVIEETTEPKEEVSEEKSVSEDKKETGSTEAKEDTSESSVKEETEQPKEEAKETKPKTKRTRRTKKELAAKENAIAEENHIEDYQKCANAMFNNLVDDNWNELKETLQNELDKIKITNDINPATLTAMAANIDEAFDMISSYYYSYKSLLEQLTDKDTGKVSYIKGINNIGTNVEDRKRNAWLACASYKEDGMNCNLLELVNITRERYNFLLCCYERIKSKQHILFTLTANLKMAAK